MDRLVTRSALLTLLLLAGAGCSSGGSGDGSGGDNTTDELLLGAAVDNTDITPIESVDPNAINGFALSAIFTVDPQGFRERAAIISIDYEGQAYRINPDDVVRKTFIWNDKGQLSSWRHGATRFFDGEVYHYNETERLSLVEYIADDSFTITRRNTNFEYGSGGLAQFETTLDADENQLSRHRYLWLSNYGAFARVSEADEISSGDISLDYDRRDHAGYMTENVHFTVDPLNDIEQIDIYLEDRPNTFQPEVTLDFDQHGNVVRLTQYTIDSGGTYNASAIIEFEYEWAGYPVANLPLHVVRHEPVRLLRLFDFIVH